MIERLPGILPGTLIAGALHRPLQGWIRLPFAAAEVTIAFVFGWLAGPSVFHHVRLSYTINELIGIGVIGILVILSAISAGRYLVRGRHYFTQDGSYLFGGLALLIGLVIGIGLPS